MENHPMLDSSGNASPSLQALFQNHCPDSSIGSDRVEPNAVGGRVKRALGDALMTEDKMTFSPAQMGLTTKQTCRSKSTDAHRKDCSSARLQRWTGNGREWSNQFQTEAKVSAKTPKLPIRFGGFPTMGILIGRDMLFARIAISRS